MYILFSVWWAGCSWNRPHAVLTEVLLGESWSHPWASCSPSSCCLPLPLQRPQVINSQQKTEQTRYSAFCRGGELWRKTLNVMTWAWLAGKTLEYLGERCAGNSASGRPRTRAVSSWQPPESPCTCHTARLSACKQDKHTLCQQQLLQDHLEWLTHTFTCLIHPDSSFSKQWQTCNIWFELHFHIEASIYSCILFAPSGLINDPSWPSSSYDTVRVAQYGWVEGTPTCFPVSWCYRWESSAALSSAGFCWIVPPFALYHCKHKRTLSLFIEKPQEKSVRCMNTAGLPKPAAVAALHELEFHSPTLFIGQFLDFQLPTWK